MKIQYKNYTIDVAEYSFDLTGMHPAKDGKIVNRHHGYFSSLENAIKKIIHLDLYEKNEETDLRGFLREYNKLLEEARSIINPKGNE